MRAMILLGVNCGYGNTDCATLPLSSLDLDMGWVDFPRPKTGIARRCALWPETLVALREVIAERGTPKGHDGCGLVFVNTRGSAWVHIRGRNTAPDNITVQFGRLLKRLGIQRVGTGFYALRHVFRTIADAARDPVAIDLIMGHADPSMGRRTANGLMTRGLRRSWSMSGCGCGRRKMHGKVESTGTCTIDPRSQLPDQKVFLLLGRLVDRPTSLT